MAPRSRHTSPHRDLRSRKSQSALNEYPRNVPPIFTTQQPKRRGASVGYRPPLRKSVSAYGPPTVLQPREDVAYADGIPSVEFPGENSSGPPRRPSVTDTHHHPDNLPTSRIGSRRPSIREHMPKSPSWHIADSGDGGDTNGEWSESQMEEDPATPALTLQALIMAAKTVPLSPEQEYRRLSRRTSDMEQQFGAN